MTRILALYTLALAALAAAGAFFLAFTGLPSVSAEKGHFAVTEWFLHTVYKNSVDLHANGTPAPPDLADPALIQLGAAHYETGCRTCHGAPGLAQGAVTRAMEPRPPYIRAAVAQWNAKELHYILQNGVKMSGMPHWPARDRPDEPWAVVAFLTHMKGMSGAEYRRLANASGASVDSLGGGTGGGLANCARCHGTDGVPHVAGKIPRLDGLTYEYLNATLAAYADGRRDSGIMGTQAIGLAPAELSQLARHYADAQPTQAAASLRNSPLIERGRALALGTARSRIPTCVSCHGPGDAPVNAYYPSLAGQPEAYIKRQLLLFQQGRGGTRFASIMHRIAPMLAANDIDALAAYYAALPRTRSARAAPSRVALGDAASRP